MKRLLIVSVAVALAAGTALAEGLKSGPQVGDSIPGPFHPMNVTGADAGKARCLVCKHGQSPVAMVFAREVSDPLATLVKKLDAATDSNKDCSMGSFVVFCNDDDKLEGKLKDLAKEKELKNIVLSIDNPAGPENYDVSKDADVTVVLYVKGKVKANYAFKKGELKEGDVEKIVADVAKIVPSK